MAERLEAFEAEIEVWTHNGDVVAVTYEGRPLHFSADDMTAAESAQYRGLYENGDAHVVLAVEVPDDDS
jgi:hypothetical protein